MSVPDLPGPSWTEAEIEQGCIGDLHPLAVRGFLAYNRGDYFLAHEDLEIAWREERGPIRDVYRGVLQIGLAYYHILRGNYRGAVKMFQRSKPWLAPYPEKCRGVAVGQLRQDAALAETELHRLGASRLDAYDRALLRPLVFQNVIAEESDD